MELVDWVPTVIFAAVLYLGRNFIKSSIQSEFDGKLERLRSDLRAKEAEIVALRESVMSGRAKRQVHIDARRVLAVERLWKAVNDFGGYLIILEIMKKIDLEEATKDLNHPSVKDIFDLMGRQIPDPKKYINVARDEEPFLSDSAWAYFSAYTAVVIHPAIIVHTVQSGLDPTRFIKNQPLLDLVKEVLPHQTVTIDTYGEVGAYECLGEIRSKLLAELRKVLDGEEADALAVEKSKSILKKVAALESENVVAEAEIARSGSSEA